MKLKTLVIGGSGLFLMVFSLLLFVAILFSDEQDSGISNIHYGGVNVSAEVLAHKPMVEKYAKEYGNNSIAYKFFGVKKSTFYKWKRRMMNMDKKVYLEKNQLLVHFPIKSSKKL